MAYYQSYLGSPGVQKGGVPPPHGAYQPTVLPVGYNITSPGTQQYIPIQQSTFYQTQSIQGTYVEVPSPPSQIKLNPNAVAYQSYTTPTPPPPHSENPMYHGAGDQGYQMYQDRPQQYHNPPIFRPYQNGPEVVRMSSPNSNPQRPSMPPAMSPPVQPFCVPPPALSSSSGQPNPDKSRNSLTLTYTDDQSMFMKDSTPGKAARSSSVEDVFKAKASQYGIQICTKADSIASWRGKQLEIQKSALAPSDSTDTSTSSVEIKSELSDPREQNDTISTDMFLKKAQNCGIKIERPDSANVISPWSSVTEDDKSHNRREISDQPSQDGDVCSPNTVNLCNKEDIQLDENNSGQSLKDKFSKDEKAHRDFVSPVDFDNCVVYCDISDSQKDLTPERNSNNNYNLDKLTLTIDTTQSSTQMSCDHAVDSDSSDDVSFSTAVSECKKDTDTIDIGEGIGIMGNFVLETLKAGISPMKHKLKLLSPKSMLSSTVKPSEIITVAPEDEVCDDTFQCHLEAYIKTIIQNALRTLAKENMLEDSRDSVQDVNQNIEKTDQNITLCSPNKNDSFENEDANFVELDCGKEHNSEDFRQQAEEEQWPGKKENEPAVSEEQEFSSTCSASWATANTGDSVGRLSEGEDSDFLSSMNVARPHLDSESTGQSSDYGDSDSTSQLRVSSPEFKPRRYPKNKNLPMNESSMRADAPVFQPLNVQTLPLYANKRFRSKCCQTEDLTKECKEVGSNTRRVKQVDRLCETVNCDTREVCINTMESLFSDDNNYFLPLETKYSEQGTLTDTLDRRSLGVLVKPEALDSCTVNRETMTDPVEDYREMLIATQRELLTLRGQLCTLEIQRQIDDLERTKLIFQTMRGESLHSTINDRITTLKIELNILKNQMLCHDAQLTSGKPFTSLPQFTVSIPFGSQSMLVNNKNFYRTSSQPGGMKRSYSDINSPEEKPVSISKVTNLGPSSQPSASFHVKPPRQFNFTSSKPFGSVSGLDSTRESLTTPDKMEPGGKESPTNDKVSSEIPNATKPTNTGVCPVINMDDIDDVSLPDILQITITPSCVEASQPVVKQSDKFVDENLNKESNLCKIEPSDIKDTKDLSMCELGKTPSIDSVSFTELPGNRPVLISAAIGNDKVSLKSDPVATSQSCVSSTFSSVTTTVTSTLGMVPTSLSIRPSPVSSIHGRASQNPDLVSFGMGCVSSGLDQSKAMSVNMSTALFPPSANMTQAKSRNIITNQFVTFGRQNVTAPVPLVHTTPVMVAQPLMATPRIIPGHPNVILYPQSMVGTVTPSLPPYQVMANIRGPLLPTPAPSRVHMPAASLLPMPAVPMPNRLPQRSLAVPSMPPAMYQGNPLFQSGQTGRLSPSVGRMGNTSLPVQTSTSLEPGQIKSTPVSSLPAQNNAASVPGKPSVIASAPSLSASSQQQIPSSMPKPAGTLDPDLYQAVITQLRQAYPQLANDPVWLETMGVQQTRVLQQYIDSSKNMAGNENTTPVSDNKPSNFEAPSSSIDLKSKEAVPALQRPSQIPTCTTETTSVAPRRPPGLASPTETDNSLTEKFEHSPELNTIDLRKTADGVAKRVVKTISDLTKISDRVNGGDLKDASSKIQKLTDNESKIFQKPKSLLDNFTRVEKVIQHEPKVSSVYPVEPPIEIANSSTHYKSAVSTRDIDSYTPPTSRPNLANKYTGPKNLPPRLNENTIRDTFHSPLANSANGENWEDEIDPDPQPFHHDFRIVRPEEKTKESWLAEMSQTKVIPGLPRKKSTVDTTPNVGKKDWWDADEVSYSPNNDRQSNVQPTVNYSQKVQQWLDINQSSGGLAAKLRHRNDAEADGRSDSPYSSRETGTPRGSIKYLDDCDLRDDVKNLDDFDLPDGGDIDGSEKGASSLSVIPLTSKKTDDLDEIFDGEGEDWHQVGKKKRKEKKPEAVFTERFRRKSGSELMKNNNFEKLIVKMSDVFTTLNREKIIQLITDVREESKGLSGLKMKQIVDVARKLFTSRRQRYQPDTKQSPTSGDRTIRTPPKDSKPVPLPIVGMTAVPGPGKSFTFKPLSMSVIQSSVDYGSIDDDEEICVICHDALTMEETKTLDCGHIFHSSCIKQWVFGQERTCPNCRQLALFPEEFPRLGK